MMISTVDDTISKDVETATVVDSNDDVIINLGSTKPAEARNSAAASALLAFYWHQWSSQK
jgi:hypothetical protein